MNILFKNQEKSIFELHSKKGRDEQNRFLIEGIKPIEELSSNHFNIESLVVEAGKENSELIQNILKKNADTPVYSCNNFRKISTLDCPEGILAVCKKPQNDNLKSFVGGKNNLLAIYEINDPGNLGTIIRTARWFGIEGIILIGNSTDEFSPKTVRSSMGAILKMPVCRIDKLENNLESLNDYYKIGSFVHHKHDCSIENHAKKMLFLGSEAHGLPDSYSNLMDGNYLIESKTGFESLNIAVAAGIMLHQIF